MDELRIFILPFLSPGHMIPLVNLGKLLAARPGVTVAVVTTAGNVPYVESATSGHPCIDILTLPFPPSVPQNASLLPNPSDFTHSPDFLAALAALQPPFAALVDAHRPDCVISDMVLPWSADVAFERSIPRLLSHGMGAFAAALSEIIHGPINSITFDDQNVFLVPGIPHRIELSKSQLIPPPPSPSAGGGSGGMSASTLLADIWRSGEFTHGTVLNTFAELEPGYSALVKLRSWLLGPLTVCEQPNQTHLLSNPCMNWLDSKSPRSVIYVCFGSVTKFTDKQLREIGDGLRDCGHSYIWVIGSAEVEEDPENDNSKGLIVRGWAPQTAILSHPAVGGFMTHCGWNSCLEGATVGLPMVTWPQFADQFYNEKLIVEVLRIGVAVGAKVWSTSADERSLVKGEEVAKSIGDVMGDGEEAERRRERAKGIAAKAREAMEEGGSSYMDMSKLIQELRELKRMRVDQKANGNIIV